MYSTCESCPASQLDSRCIGALGSQPTIMSPFCPSSTHLEPRAVSVVEWDGGPGYAAWQKMMMLGVGR